MPYLAVFFVSLIMRREYLHRVVSACDLSVGAPLTTYPMMPARAMSRPRTHMSATARPEESQPRTTMMHVLLWPTTVLETGPDCAMMKNWETLMRTARAPD